MKTQAAETGHLVGKGKFGPGPAESAKSPGKSAHTPMKTNVTLIGDRILIRLLERDKMSPGGLHLPDTAQRSSQRGVLVAVGPGKIVDGKRQPMELKVGQTILFMGYGGTIELDGEKFTILNETDVLGVLD